MNIEQALRLAITQGLHRLDAESLLCHILQQNKVYLITHNKDVLDIEQYTYYQNMCAQLILGYPLAYILGYKEFYSLNFKVTPDVLIPRADTECLVEFAIQNAPRDGYVLDLGTGSGIIAIALAYYRPDLTVYGCDISLKALEVAAYNAKQNKCEHIKWIHSNWFENIPKTINANNTISTVVAIPIKWDMIISNPPYIHSNDMHLQQSIRFEPRYALTDEQDGLQHIQHIIKHAVDYLKPDALLAIEHGYQQHMAAQDMFKQFQYHSIKYIQDLSKHIRVTYAYTKK
jgi:release factor glutamine methyltransferase